MTEPDAASSQVPDFTIHREPITFRIDDDIFSAPAFTAPFTLKALAAEAASVGDVGNLTDVQSVIKAMDSLGKIMGALMPGPSGQLFKRRLESQGRPERQDEETGEVLPADPPPIDLMGQAIPAFYFLLERKGLRPTVPSSGSPAGSTGEQTSTQSDGTSSTDGLSPMASTSDDSTSPTGST